MGLRYLHYSDFVANIAISTAVVVHNRLVMLGHILESLQVMEVEEVVEALKLLFD